ncbi:hypothetical protein K493DRAFT_316031 [Basidiobolus meristosporus CBS 931.73]|uniref:Uncharacterized protein n=1 Tax=Basidiobolus meristosporus CBS 931.73 TaxID=1314790 RepID=A0A1Y1Y736_9FUNG|nr:hypothetical protein K493DRAFT_316031 [Basidiobolus meristosporus CBS 931.73]|eukprot:ORX93394.1 hypothetical protein K493DRAFT_316031 [Basidiobolus meristosporus CBS 931.73]
MKFIKRTSISQTGSGNISAGDNTRTNSEVVSSTRKDAQDMTTARSSSGQLNITSYRMHVLETESQYLYEQNRKLSRELKNAQRTNEALVNIIKNKDRQIDSIVHDQHEALLRAHAIEQSMRLMLLDDDKQGIKDPKNHNKHTGSDSLQKFVAALKSIHPPPYQTKSSHPDAVIPRRSSGRRPKYTKPLLPPLATIYDNEEDVSHLVA